MVLLTMLLIPSLVAFGFFLFGGKKITLLEFGGQMVAQVLIMSCVMWMMSCSNTRDTETWNGKVSDKKREKVSCSHSYKCFCYQSCSTDSNGNTSCHEVCQTCYEHSYDVDWAVYTTLDERMEISRIDRQGLGEPPRWTAVKIGEPTSSVHNYTNYVKASPDSLFRHQGLVDKFKGKLPEYPQNVYDYYRMDRLVNVGVPRITPALWNKMLSELNADLGKPKQVNILLVLVKNQPEDYFYALQQHWIGAKKNDVALVISVGDDNSIQWAEVMAWTQDKMIEVTLRDDALQLGSISDELLPEFKQILHGNIDVYYKRKPMSEFEYLASTVTPTFGQWIFAMIFGLIVSIGIGLFVYHNDIEEETPFYRRY